MGNFFKDAWRELQHVVWPTRKETKKYFSTVMVILICFGIYLFIANVIFSEILFGVKDAISGGNHSSIPPVFDPNSIVISTGSVESSGSIVGSGNIVE